ncbi:MAG: phage tail protein [Elusimicrobiota bacterium]
MKKILSIISVILVMCVYVQAAVPNEITYQGRLREYGKPVTGARNMEVAVFGTETGGSALWTGTYTGVQVSSGVFTVSLSPEGTVDWRKSDLWIETKIGSQALSPRNKITAQGYALHARTAEDMAKSAGETINFLIGTSTNTRITSAGLEVTGKITVDNVEVDNITIGTTGSSGVLRIYGDIESTGTIKGVRFKGDGSKLTGVYASSITAEGIVSGTINDLRLSSNVTKFGNSIESGEITNGTIVNEDINNSAAIAWSKIDKTGAVASDIGALSASLIAADDFTQLEVDNLRSGKLDDGTMPWTNATVITSGEISSTLLDANLQDLIDGTLSASKVENGTYFIDSVGTSGQVWKSDGSGKGIWGTDNNTQLSEGDVESYIANDITSGYVPYSNGTKLVTSAIFTNGTNVGIGTSSASNRLHLYTDTVNAILLRTENGNGWTYTGTDTLGDSILKAGSNKDVKISDDSNNGIIVKDGGNVGIGTTAPTAKLSVEGDISLTGNIDGIDLSVKASAWDTHESNTSNPHTVTASQLGLGNVTNTNILNSWSQNDGQYIATDEIRARDSGGISIRDDAGNLGLMIQDGGKVGIGTTLPNGKLSIDGSFTSQAYSDHSRLIFNNSKNYGIGAGQISASANDKDLYIWSEKDATNKDADIRFMSTTNGNYDPSNESYWQNNMIIKGDSGNVGIGKINPQALLDVNGKIKSDELEVSTRIKDKTGFLMPVGAILAYSSTTAPEGFLYCDGTAVSRTEYADLFLLVQEIYGEGDGSTTFNLPDFRGRFLRGVDDGSGRDPDVNDRPVMNLGGETNNAVGSVQADEFKGHAHNVYYNTQDASPPPDNSGAMTIYGLSNSVVYEGAQSRTNYQIGKFNLNSSGGNETRPENAYVAYIIKY